jgi:hypothetical protein
LISSLCHLIVTADLDSETRLEIVATSFVPS